MAEECEFCHCEFDGDKVVRFSAVRQHCTKAGCVKAWEYRYDLKIALDRLRQKSLKELKRKQPSRGHRTAKVKGRAA